MTVANAGSLATDVSASQPIRVRRTRRLGPAVMRNRRGMTRTPRGFTLVEALVAVAILGLVALLAWRATAAMTDGEARLAEESARWQQLDGLLTRIEADLRAALPRRARHGTITEAPWSLATLDAAGNALLIFTRAGPEAIDEPGVGGQRVGYRWRDGRVEALYWPQIDNPATSAPSTFALVDGVARFRIVAAGADDRWFDRWPPPGGSDLPRGVRVELTLADGSTIERWLALQ
jgi:general secretion pathway protein J